jgi:dTDP-glucose 4,6-dehydratase
MSTVYVTGALGTLGSKLVPELQKRGHSVWGCDLKHSEHDWCTRADVSNYRQITEDLSAVQPDYIFHLAAEFGRNNGEEYYEQLWTTNAIGTRNILEYLPYHDCQLIFASSSEIYGEQEYDLLYEGITEEAPLLHHNEYALSKWVNEVQIRNFTKRNRLEKEPTILRFFNAYGPGEQYHPYRSVVSLFCYRALHDIPYDVYEDYYRTFMYIDDFIPTLANAATENVAGKTINIGGQDFRSVKDLSDIVLKELNKDDSQVNYLSQEKHNVASKKPLITEAMYYLEHNPLITIDIGVPDTMNWMKEFYGR